MVDFIILNLIFSKYQIDNTHFCLEYCEHEVVSIPVGWVCQEVMVFGNNVHFAHLIKVISVMVL